MNNHGVKIIGTGSYLPERVLTNDELSRLVDTSDEWIRTRTGIRERHIAAPDEPSSALGAKAALRALEMARLTATDIDLIIVATLSPDRPFPNTACFVQKRLGATRAACFSVEAACSGFVYILEIASAMLRTGAYQTALVIGAEKFSSILNWEDRSTCVLFGDGAGAAVLARCPIAENHLVSSRLGSDGTYTDILGIPVGGSETPITAENLAEHRHYVTMSGQEVFKQAVPGMSKAALEALEAGGVSVEQVRWLIPHQANLRIISSVAKRLGIPDERIYINLDKYGNTSAASIPIALDELVRGGQIAEGDYLLLVAFGGGLTWGATLLRW